MEQQTKTAAGSEEVVLLRDWVVALILMAIPVVGFIMILVWSFSAGTNVNLRNFARASLIVVSIVLFLYVILFVLIGMAASSYTY
ncbi:hypothetical protein B0X71_14295 [Planococcus lenghuensis]|uniref:Uncharacterized protein n=1 Tax=Planococcus lenghuensis TaxID=2213202 RepID=A0A1Q2L3U4_9BACL|nr:hypothetical protein B0X71_14295 [Planococcus lenghuensis]